MRILYNTSDIFQLPKRLDEAVCVTTNSMIRKDGHAVMGRGIAKTANDRFRLSLQLAEYLRKYGNRAFYLGPRTDVRTGRTFAIITFPTKQDWKDDSDLELIRTSAEQVVRICDKFGIRTCYLTCPGCANGHLDWESQVKPVIEPILDDRFVIADTSLHK